MPTATPTPSPDRAVLISLYRETGGPNWNENGNWLSDRPIGEWHGVETDGDDRVADLLLNSNGLSGKIPSEIGDLAELRRLHLWDNELAGQVPFELGNLRNLRELVIDQNRLSGGIPPSLGDLAKLEILYLSENMLEGPIPVELGNLWTLEWLYLQNNRLTGEIPPELGKLARLTHLWLAANDLTGEIPPELGNLSHLVELVLFENRIRGAVPRELGELSNLLNLRLDFNQLSGEIPPELGRLSKLTGFEILENQLSGEIPPELADLKQLRTLFLSRNPGLGGCMPDDLLDIENNDFEHLDLQPCDALERGVLAELFETMDGDNWTDSDGWLSDAPFEQWYGVSMDSHGRVSTLDLTDNGVSGEIPVGLSRLTRLRQVRLGGNQIVGCIPLAVLAVSDNDFDVLGIPECPEPTPTPEPLTLEDLGALPWFADGLEGFESDAVNHLSRFIGSEDELDRRLAEQVVNAGWFTDGIDSDEAWTMGVLADIVANYRQVLPAIVEFKWAFDDDLPWPEWNTITRVRDLEFFNPGSGLLLVELQWLYDDISDTEDWVLATIRDLAEFDTGLDARIIGLPWIADGVTYADGQAVQGLGNVLAVAHTIDSDPFDLLGLLVEEAEGPYRPLEITLMRSIGLVPLEEEERRKLLEDLTGADWFVDGLTDVERVHIIAFSSRHNDYRELPNFNTGIISSKVVELPLAGEVKLWLVGSSTVPWDNVFESLEEAATGAEWLMGEPFPINDLVVSIVGRFDYEGNIRPFGGLSLELGRHIALIDGLSAEVLRDIIQHEVAHTYFTGLMGAGWFAEAGAEYTREFIHALKGYSALDDRDRLKLLVRNHCTSRGVPNIVEALAADPAIPRFCKNMIGMLLLLELEEAVGVRTMTAALGELHRMVLTRGVANSDRDIYEAFLRHAPPGTEHEVRELWDSRYGPLAEEGG